MNKEQYLLECLIEEAAEVVQRCTKALRFGLYEIQLDQKLNNLQRLNYELNDLIGVIEILNENGIEININNREAIDLKKEKIKKYMDYSKEIGILTE